MKKAKFNQSTNFIFFVAAFVLLGLGSACAPPEQGTGNTQQVNTNANLTQPANSSAVSNSAPAKAQNNSRLPVTLPVLDAMFYDEEFTQELKTKLQLNDQQIEQIKNISSEAVGGLGEDGTDESSAGSTRAATKRAEEQIRGILGDEKTDQLFETVRVRWSSGEAELAGGKANTVPGDTRIVVNAPAYRMDVFQDGKLLKTYRIGIGYPEFPLPTGMRKADTVIFNPTWTPPDEPWVKGKVKPGQKVEAGSKLNPLGPIKIPIGLPSLIHGGKDAARLGGFASHGCVGLTNGQVQDFSQVLAQISGTQLTPEDVKNYEKQKTETKNFKLSNSVPIELRYETIVVEDGKLKIFRDVYERGTNTLENLRGVLSSHGVAYESLTEQERASITQALNDMNRDAQGNPIVENVEIPAGGAGQANSANANASANASNKSANANSQNKNSNSSDDGGKVTRSIKGKKEVVFQIAQLQGKGYPAPVALNAGK